MTAQTKAALSAEQASLYADNQLGLITAATQRIVTQDIIDSSATLLDNNTFTATTDTVSPSTGAIIIQGGVGLAKSLSVGGTITANQYVGPAQLSGPSTAPTVTPGDNSNNVATTAFVASSIVSAAIITPSNANPLINGTAAPGTATAYSRGDHVHPTDTTRAPLASPALTGTPTAPTAAALTNNTQLATTNYADRAVSTLSTTVSTTYAPLASPALTGNPTAPTQAALTNNTRLATTAYADSAVSTLSGTVSATYAPLASPALTGAPTAPTAALGDSSTLIATTAFVGANTVVRSYLAGFTISTAGSSTTFTVAPGQAADSTNVDWIALASAMSKTGAPWAAGSGNGGLDTGSMPVGTGTWYHIYVIMRTDTGQVDVVFSLSATGPTVMPSPYTLFRRIGAWRWNTSNVWASCSQHGDEFLWAVGNLDYSNVATTTAARTIYTLLVPTGVQVNALVLVQLLSTAGPNTFVITSLDVNDVAVGFAAGSGGSFVRTTAANDAADVPVNVRTSTSAQIGGRSSATTATVYFLTLGWIDRRGRDN